MRGGERAGAKELTVGRAIREASLSEKQWRPRFRGIRVPPGQVESPFSFSLLSLPFFLLFLLQTCLDREWLSCYPSLLSVFLPSSLRFPPSRLSASYLFSLSKLVISLSPLAEASLYPDLRRKNNKESSIYLKLHIHSSLFSLFLLSSLCAHWRAAQRRAAT